MDSSKWRTWVEDYLNPKPQKRMRLHAVVGGLILINLLALIFGSAQTAPELYRDLYEVTFFSGALFLLEYLARLWLAPMHYPDSSSPRLRYVFSFFGWVDLLSLLPFLVPLLFPNMENLREFIDFMRFIQILKLMRFSRSFQLLSQVIRLARAELVIALTLNFMVVSFASISVYMVERAAQPEAFASVGDGFWWAIITFATVGYGDLVPITALGKVLASATAIVGVGMIALPTAIISSTLMEVMRRRRAEQRGEEGDADDEACDDVRDGVCDADAYVHTPARYCPHCGKPLDQH